ncbi:MAG: glycoside hydrolase family 65 protein [Bacteroidia bacterium]
MKQYIQHDEWNIIENNFDPHLNKISESLFSIGNGRMGQRANFEEQYTGESLQGTYIAGVYYPDKTRVGWWKNGYPEYFAKVLNAPYFTGINIEVNGEQLNLATCKVIDFKRILNMKEGTLNRSFTATLNNGVEVKVNAQRFMSIVDDECAAIRYSITANQVVQLLITSYIDADVKNSDSNYDEKFWNEIHREAEADDAYITTETKKTLFHVCTGINTALLINGSKSDTAPTPLSKEKYVAQQFQINANANDEITIIKYCSVTSSENYEKSELVAACRTNISNIYNKGYDAILNAHKNAWAKKWTASDIIIEGDVAAQQGIRFNIFQLNQTYTGEDERLNIGPKGFTGEKYGGSTYWDTEAYCIPFYLSTANERVARNLLIYRYKHLQKAIENAAKLGFKNGAALYPMVTMNGEECHNEWEITFEEIHRNGAIAFAIYNYLRYTNDKHYLAEYGLEVLIGIARFWAQRVNWSIAKKKYVMLGVTGPNEYENNVNNNWYSNYLAAWCLDYAGKVITQVKNENKKEFKRIISKTNFDIKTELKQWKDITKKMFYPYDKQLDVFLQQEGYLDKEQILAKDIPASERPLNQKWSWDRILRSCFIKQADVLQGIYLFEDDFSKQTIKNNFDFYEPRTVHESSLSPCVHAILACSIGNIDKAYEMYLRTARLDLDDYNNDTEDGCHTTSMAGTWMSIVQGFGGMRVRNNQLHFIPFLPSQWQSYSFKIMFRGALLKIKVNATGVEIENQSAQDVHVFIFEKEYLLSADNVTSVSK